MATCQAHRHDGKPCKGQAVTGRHLCRLHGGKSLVGMANPQYKGAGYSRYLPVGGLLKADYDQALQDPEQTSAKKEIALLESRVAELTRRLSSSDLGHAWRDAQAALLAYEQAQQVQDSATMREALGQLSTLVKAGASQYALWQELQATSSTLVKMRSAEVKRAYLAGQVISRDELMQLVLVLMGTMRESALQHFARELVQPFLADVQARVGKLVGGVG